jgi:hypothetical protein
LTVDLSSSSDELPGSLARLALAGQYTTLIADSAHPREIEAAIEVACELHRALNDAYVQYLSGSAKAKPGKPGFQNQSPRWREAETGAFASVRVLAAILGARYPSPTGQPPIGETQQLVINRVGPLCNGWHGENTDEITHHPKDPCPLHG